MKSRVGTYSAVIGLIGLAVAALTGQASKPTTVEAQAFVVKDASGTIRARLGVNPKNESMLVLYGPDGEGKKDDGHCVLIYVDVNSRAWVKLWDRRPVGAMIDGKPIRPGEAQSGEYSYSSLIDVIKVLDADNDVVWRAPR